MTRLSASTHHRQESRRPRRINPLPRVTPRGVPRTRRMKRGVVKSDLEITTTEEVSDSKLRRWLTLLNQPDRLIDEDIERLLRIHNRLPSSQSQVDLGQAAAELLKEKIDRLKPPDGAGRTQQLPYLVLETCFVQGAKLFQAAARLGLSERQLSRERSRAISLLHAELFASDAARPYREEPIPAIGGLLPRPGQLRAIGQALESHHLVMVSGPPGIGKTTLVAKFATDLRDATPVLWYRFRPGINSTLTALLYELGEYLYSKGEVELATYMQSALPQPETSLATRLALKGFDSGPHLLVFDDFHLVEEDDEICGLVDELISRLPQLRVITTGRHRYTKMISATAMEVAPFTRAETRDFLVRLKVDCAPNMVRTIHQWTEGNAHLIKLAASWLKTASPQEVAHGVASLKDSSEVQNFLLDYITELLDSDDRALLEAASIFRERFPDDALSFVAERTRGTVMDASIRLVRSYVATRSLDGQSAFFHGSVRDYVYSRLEPEFKSELHERAALWYKRHKQLEEAEYHLAAAEKALDF